MRRFEITELGGADRLTLADAPDPEPGDGKVLVRLKACSLNYRDLMILRGDYGTPPELPLVPLSDGAGEVVAAGARVVITSSSDEKLERASELGADKGVNYRKHEDWDEDVKRLTDGRGVDLVTETGGAKRTQDASCRQGPRTLELLQLSCGRNQDAR